IEATLLGFNVIVLEQRTDFTRNNVLHLWPFVIEDLKHIGVKTLFPKFCVGAMNHISIKRLQCILLKLSLVLGIQVYTGVSYETLKQPGPGCPTWSVMASNGLQIEADVLVCAQGKRVTLSAVTDASKLYCFFRKLLLKKAFIVSEFDRREFRGKLAIAITANFVNNKTSAEAMVEEISGIAYVYKQDFFNALYDDLGIALENFVYYKDETHYFVMTTKKHSLLTKKVLKKDNKDPQKLLLRSNINQEKLLAYIKDTCDYCTDYQLPNTTFALNHHGEPDVALFDFTSMNASRNSIYVKEKHGVPFLMLIIGDGLLEPFWPTGSGCAKGFLGAFDACWTMLHWSLGEKSIFHLLAERENLYKLLPQVTSENISKKFDQYSVDPFSRYPRFDSRISTRNIEQLYENEDKEQGNCPPYVPLRNEPPNSLQIYIHNSTKVGLTPAEPAEYVKEKIDFDIAKFMQGRKPPPKREEVPRRGPVSKDMPKVPREAIVRHQRGGKTVGDISNSLFPEKKPLEARRSPVKNPIPSPSPIGEGDINEIDNLLSRLESDANFQHMTDNEQQSWLESLFFLDTRTTGTSLFGPNSRANQAPPVARPPRELVPREGESVVRTRAPTQRPKEEPKKAELPGRTSDSNISVNENLIATAQSYFNMGAKPAKKTAAKKIPVAKKMPREELDAGRKAQPQPPARTAQQHPKKGEMPEEMERRKKKMKLVGNTLSNLMAIDKKFG
ncbi:hypothetical protein TCAL_01080, partial [Tigriopus californicus]